MKGNTPDNTRARLIITTTKITRFETLEERAKRLEATVGKRVEAVGQEEKAKLDVSLIKMLIILSKAGEDGLNTRKLLTQFQSVGPGQVVLKRAVEEGFVRRVEVKREDKKGRGGSHVTMNYITPAGKRHLKGLLDD